jgi:N-acetylmuramoyl-L-alanine amidase
MSTIHAAPKRIVISSGHGKYIRGASGLIDEVDEARRMVPRIAAYLREVGHKVQEFHDDTSTTQSQNLETIVAYHNDQSRDLDVSVHFNAYVPTEGGRGTEVLYLTQATLAQKVVDAIAAAGHLINRGIKKRTDLAFLNNTDAPAILIETCFVDAGEDVRAYEMHFDAICQAIGYVGTSTPLAHARFAGTCSWFGGPDDQGVTPSEGLAFIYEYEMAPHLFLDEQPEGTSGLARRLNPGVPYVACRWDYAATPKTMLVDKSIMARVRAKKTGKEILAWPSDWGPHEEKTGRAADLSPGLMAELGIATDDEVEVIYPVRA